MKKNGKMEIEKIIYVCNLKIIITPKNFHSNPIFQALRVCNLKIIITPKNFHSNPIFQALRSKYSGNLKSY